MRTSLKLNYVLFVLDALEFDQTIVAKTPEVSRLIKTVFDMGLLLAVVNSPRGFDQSTHGFEYAAEDDRIAMLSPGQTDQQVSFTSTCTAAEKQLIGFGIKCLLLWSWIRIPQRGFCYAFKMFR